MFKRFYDLKIATKLFIAFLLMAIGTVVVGYIGIESLAHVNSLADKMHSLEMQGLKHIKDANIALAVMGRVERNFILARTPEEREKYRARRVEFRKQVEDSMRQAKVVFYTERGKEMLAKAEEAWRAYDADAQEVIDMITQDERNRSAAIDVSLGKGIDHMFKADEVMQDTAALKEENAEKAATEAAATYSRARLYSICLIVGCTVGGLAMAFCISRTIAVPLKALTASAAGLAKGDVEQRIVHESADETGELAQSFSEMIAAVKSLMAETDRLAAAAKQGDLKQRGDAAHFDGAYRQLVLGFNETLDAVVRPIAEASEVLNKVADRDLSPRMQGAYQSDHAQIKNALNAALDNLEEALGQAAQGAEQVTAAATQISNGSQSLAQGASEQASSLEEVSSSLEEMSSMTKQNADNSNQGKALAADAQQAAERGNEAMLRMGEAIGKIKDSSDATAKIVKTIDEIAFQTNLLALNAAVEAARAGEAGKGFAVVAEEVRNLAQRSAESAKNTANMIEESVKNAEGGVRITEEVARALAEIAEGNRKVNDLVAEIAAASNEQSKGIDQINLAVQQLDKVTQQTAANSEESASAAEELNSQAAMLAGAVAQFKLSRPAATSPAALTTAVRQTPRREQRTPAALKESPRERELAGAAAGAAGRVTKASLMIPLDEDDFKGF